MRILNERGAHRHRIEVMGYTLRFGNYEVNSYPEDRHASATAGWNGVERPENPPIDSTGISGSTMAQTWPGYCAWHEFVLRHDLLSVFFAGARGETVTWWLDENGEERSGLISSHPGAEALDEHHLAQFERALEAYKQSSGLTYEEAKHLVETDVNAGNRAYDMIRLNWLVFWTRETIARCEYPTFANS